MVAIEEPLTVLVIMKPSSRRKITAESALAATVGQLAPSARSTQKLRRYLQTAGCDVGPLVGVSFAVTIPAALAEQLLGTAIDGEFDISRLPTQLCRSVQSIVRDRPIDFGPVSFV